MDNWKLLLILVGVDVDYYINFKLENREGDDYLTIDTSTADFNSEMVYIDIKNIFGDNNELGESGRPVIV